MRRILSTCLVIAVSIGMANCMPTFKYHFRQVEVGDGESDVFGLPKEVKLQGKPSDILDSLAQAGFKLIIPAKFLRAHYVTRPKSDDATINAAIEVIIVPLKMGQKKAGWACTDKRADKLACAMFNDWIRHHLTWKGPDEFKNASETIERRISLIPKARRKFMDVERLLSLLFSGRLSFAPGTDFIEVPYLKGNLHGQKHRINLSLARKSDTEPAKAEISATLAKLPPGLEREEVFQRLPLLVDSLACQLGTYTEMAQENGYRGMAIWSSGDRQVEISWQGFTGGEENSGTVGVTIKPNANLRSEQTRQYLIEELGIDPATSVLTYEIADSPPRPGICTAQ